MKLKTIKSFLAVALVAAGLSAWATPQPIGTSTVTWELTNNNTVLTIGGTGAMPDFDRNSPWYSNRTKILTVNIGSGVTSIGSTAFYNCSKMTSVTIPAGVTSIGLQAFNGCSKMTSVTIPTSVKSIGEQAFNGCDLLESVMIPSGVESIGDQTFANCSGLKSVMIPTSVESIGVKAFYLCPALESVTIPTSVKSIGKQAFLSSGLKSVTIPSSVTSFGENAFQSCTALEAVTLSEGLESIGEYAFNKCAALTTVTIPSSVESIGNFAFSNCKALAIVVEMRATPPTAGSSIVGSSTSFNGTIFVPAASVETYTGAGGWSTYAGKIKGFDPVGEKTYVFTDKGECTIYGEGAATALPDGFDRNSIKSVVVQDGITEIGAKFFEDCLFLNSVKIGRDVGKIGEKAFWFCMSLEKVEIGNPDFDLGSLDKAIVYQTAIDRDGTPYPIPDVSVSGCLQMLFGKRELTDADWTELGAVGEKPMTEYGEYRFFRIVLKKKAE